MKKEWKLGCAGFPLKLSDYFQLFTAVEIQETFFDPPGRRTLERWRRQSPAGFVFVVRAWQLITHPPAFPGYKRIRRPWEKEAKSGFGFFRPGEQTQWAWSVVQEAQEILEARAVLFQTPASFTPTREHRENLVRFFNSIQRRDCHLVWDPEGVWEEEEVEALCSDLGLVRAVDPLLNAGSHEEVFYFRMQTKTRGQGIYTPDDFYRIYYEAEGADRKDQSKGFLIWSGPKAVRDAKGFESWSLEHERIMGGSVDIP